MLRFGTSTEKAKDHAHGKRSNRDVFIRANENVSAIDDETSEQMLGALEDIKEWFNDNGAPDIINNLNPPTTIDDMVQIAGTAGLVIHPELQWLYQMHNGQPTLERFPFFESCTFLSVKNACNNTQESLMIRYFGMTSLRDAVNVEYLTTIVFDEPLEPGETDNQWFPFANRDGDFYAVHARTGRVARFLKGDSPAGVVVAPSLCDFLCDYADALWRDVYELMGDPEIDAVTTSGLIYLGAYAGLG